MQLGEPIFQKVDANEGISNFMRGFALVAQMNQHKQQQELQIQKMQMEAELAQKENAIKSRQLDITAKHNEHTYEIETRQQNRIAEREKFVAGQTQAQAEAAAAMMSDVNSIEAEHGTQEWRDKVYDTLLKHPGASRSPEYNLLAKQANKTSANPAVKTQQSVLDNRIKMLGLNKNAVYRALNDPSVYTEAIPGDPNKIGIHVGERLDPVLVKTRGIATNTGDLGPSGNKETTVTPTKLFVPVPKSTWEGLKTTFDSVNGTADGTARMMPQPSTPTLRDRAQEALEDPDATPAEKAAARKILAGP